MASRHQTVNPPLRGKDLESATIILNTTADIIHDSNERIAALYKVKVDNLRSAPFEVGYLVYTIQEKYRKMVDKYNTSHFMNTRLYIMELVMYLEEIEHHYWEIEHLTNMAHEIERKYKIKTDLNEDYKMEAIKGITTSLPIVHPPNPYGMFITKKKKFKWAKFIQNYNMSTTTKRPIGPFPFDYGWDVEGLPF